MEFLYNAYACEKFDESGKMLLPGYVAQPDKKPLKPGTKIHVELADGTPLHTVVVKMQPMFFAESAQAKLFRATSGLYCAVIVPNDFDAPGIELGAKVFLED